jgi:hypothetical protein
MVEGWFLGTYLLLAPDAMGGQKARRYATELVLLLVRAVRPPFEHWPPKPCPSVLYPLSNELTHCQGHKASLFPELEVGHAAATSEMDVRKHLYIGVERYPQS